MRTAGPAGDVNFIGVKLATDEQGEVWGKNFFKNAGRVIEEESVNVPTALSSHSTGIVSVNFLDGPQLGGQHIQIALIKVGKSMPPLAEVHM